MHKLAEIVGIKEKWVTMLAIIGMLGLMAPLIFV